MDSIRKSFMEYMKKTVSPYHAVEAGAAMLEAAGFRELSMTGPFSLEEGGKYYAKLHGSSMFAFTVGSGSPERRAFHIAAAHTDFPCLHLKPAAELAGKGYLSLNAEAYGGAIRNTWLDRPLSLAGRVVLRGTDPYRPETVYYDAARPLLTIPNLAVHINRKVNEGVELKGQTDMLPLFGLASGKWKDPQYFLDFLADELHREKSDILDFDLYVYNAEEGMLLGAEEEFFSCPRLDNQTSCFALLHALIHGECSSGINVIALYDNEEIGSRSKQGADSALLTMLLEKIYAALGLDRTALNEAVLRSFLFSVDVAHALHPNHPEKYDPVNYSLMNDGVVFKISISQRYTYDAEAVATAQLLCEKAGAKFKKFVNHSDMPGGGTIGPVISSWLPMKAVDIGVPLLAMHSARELMGIEDEEHLIRLLTEFFS